MNTLNNGEESPESPRHSEMTLTEGILYLLAVLVRYRWFILIVTAISAGGVLIFSIYSLMLPPDRSPLPNRFEAGATLIFQQEDSQSGLNAILQNVGMTAPNAATSTPATLALQILDSNSFLDTIIERNEMVDYYSLSESNRTRRRAFVKANAGVSFSSATGILTVTYQDTSPEYAKTVVDSMVEELEQWFLERSGRSRVRTLELLQSTLIEVEREVQRLEEQILAFQERHGSLTVEEMATAQSNVLRDLETELIGLERAVQSVSETTRLTNDPELLRLRSERDTVINLIEQIEAGYAGGDRRLPRRTEFPELALQLGRLQADMEIQQRIRTTIQEQYEIARLSVESRTGFTVLEPAETPDTKIGPFRAQISIIVTSTAFALSIALSLAHFWLSSIYASPELARMMAVVKEAKRD